MIILIIINFKYNSLIFLKLFRIDHDNTVTTRTDLAGRVVSMTDTAGNATVTREYAYDSLARPVTRRTARQGNIVNDSFACNSRSELASATVSGRTYGYSYDNVGNRKTAREDAEEACASAIARRRHQRRGGGGVSRGSVGLFLCRHQAHAGQPLQAHHVGQFRQDGAPNH